MPASPNPLARLAILASLASLLLALASGCGGGGGSAKTLRSGVEDALRKGDAQALLGHAELKGSPSSQYFALLDALSECAQAEEGVTVALQPMDEAARTAQQATLKAQDAELASAPEGLLVVSVKGGTGQTLLKIPYGTIQGRTVLLGGRLLPAKRAELAALDALKTAEKCLADGLLDENFNKKDPTWKDGAQALSVGGGEPGAAWSAKVAKLAAAVASADADAAAAATGLWGQNVLGPTTFDGKPVPEKVRKLKLVSQATRFLRTGNVVGGWIKEAHAVLAVEGEDHSGNTKRGAVFMKKAETGWEEYASDLVEIPAP